MHGTGLPRMTLRRLVPLVLLLALPASQAQVMPTSTIEITLSDDGPTDIQPGGNASVTVTVDLGIRNVVCTQDTVVTVDLSATPSGTAPGLTAALSASSMEFVVPMGAHTSQGFEDSEEATFDITLAASSSGNFTMGYNITASYGGGTVCTAASPVPEAEDTAEYSITAQAPAMPPGEDEGEDGEGGGGGGGGGNGIPGPGVPLLLVGLAAIAAFARRR